MLVFAVERKREKDEAELTRHTGKLKAKTIYTELFDFELKRTSCYSIAVDSTYPLNHKKQRKMKLLRAVREPTPLEVMKMDNWGGFCSFCALGSKIYAAGDSSTKVKMLDLNNVDGGWRNFPYSSKPVGLFLIWCPSAIKFTSLEDFVLLLKMWKMAYWGSLRLRVV